MTMKTRLGKFIIAAIIQEEESDRPVPSGA
jgi:hypothetical protein